MPLLLTADCVDDLIIDLHQAILADGVWNDPTKGENLEILGVYLILTDPIRRISRTESRSKMISCLGELLWYLSAQNDLVFIQHFIPHYKEFAESDGRIHGGYGPRLFRMRGLYNQLENVIRLLQEKKPTRRAVIQLFDASDLMPESPEQKEYADIPCTISLQFIVRSEELHLFVCMRSNDAFKGLTHDVFAFTMLQEFVARLLGCKLGHYHHFVSSMHLYKADFEKVEALQKEGYMSTLPVMEPMPVIQTLSDVSFILGAEKALRENKEFDLDTTSLDEYWKDLLRIIKTHFLLRTQTAKHDDLAREELSALKNQKYRFIFDGKIQ
ncbi:TPA: thymidylate synthase [Yersinia enterocolitica]|uniref:thymidylate synthase n=1 Tax=Yersinia enterocolitica TaxID=630 RepID=UPI0021E7CDDC|nr:thymidylate synthase [Yersinia enterocolitica]EKN3946276.1 thymidylate synthase [Yersinia enterocolitica]EKN5071909.1 thymidylate synthase [Yersinia enterocolitica]EKN6315924.1 thymidylate synthase [Yersinia enterocolitica]UYJ95876.1 thymidylate synthase [Yersinia enterocolitica]HDL6672179.1 thymidylate synthase [Yersinia enterocolitica]